MKEADPEVSSPRLIPKGRPITGGTFARAQEIVDEVLERAARQGERNTAWVRLALCGLATVVWPSVAWDSMRVLAPSVVLVEILCVGGVLFSALMLRRTARSPTTPAQRNVSIVVDCLLVLGFLVGFVFVPPPAYWGVTRVGGLGAIYVALVTAGTRLSRRGVQLAFVIITAGLAGLIVLDNARNPALAHNGIVNISSIFMILSAAALSSYFTASKTRSLVLESARQTWKYERARHRLGAYVSEEVAAASLAAEEMSLGGQRQTVAVLFSDLRGFTTMAESRDADVVVRDLNEYFQAMVEAIRAHGGVIDKYIGDSIMAVFGAPTPRDDDAARALRAAMAMEEQLLALNERREIEGKSRFVHGIGVHVGDVVAGHIGTEERTQYTVIGDAVNVASRLESATRERGVTLLASAAVWEAARGARGVPALVPVGDIKLRGRDASIRAFALENAALAGDPRA